MGGLAHPFSIYEALEVEGVVIGDRARVYRLPLGSQAPAAELQVAALPHFSRHQALAQAPEAVRDPEAWVEEQVARTVKGLTADLDPALPSVFVGHCHVNQAALGEAQNMFGISDVEVSLSTLISGRPLPYYALGHVHKRQVLSDDPFVAYSGSLERVDFSEGERVDVAADGSVRRREAEAKGFYRADLVGGGSEGWRLAAPPEFRRVRARSFVTLRMETITHDDPMAALRARIECVREAGVDLTDALVRITGTIDPDDRARLNSTAARRLLPDAYAVRIAFEAQDAPAARDPRFAKQMSEIEALDRYLETRADWRDDRAELARLGRDLITEAGA
jgi:exonuclease SbcD